MVRWIAAGLLLVAAVHAHAGDTGVRVSLTGLPTLPAHSGPVRLVDVIRHMAVSSQGKGAALQVLTVHLPDRAGSKGSPQKPFTGPGTLVAPNTVASF
ncbi:MAG: hypothetical protein NZ869_00115 [Thermoanaerobaculum sp.]|nr:hypothetical protein [Thermoanaerobaculum sp.]MDW7967978.1 hypothetical protein [Thermoanaerobaculum sp.]